MTEVLAEKISGAQAAIKGTLIETPTLALTSDRWRAVLPDIASGTVKLELFQQAGSFKARGAYLGISGLSAENRAKGVVAASGGNHAMAVAWAAQKLGVSAKIAIPRAADQVRIDGCRATGAEVILCDDIVEAFAVMEESAAKEGRVMMHPFEGEHMTLGSATCGAEFVAAHPEIDLFIIPVGGGGMISGMSAAIKLARPDATVIGVEPFGADSMFRSFAAGEPVRLDKISTIADSLASPLAMPYSFGVTHRYTDEIVRVEDEALRHAMRMYQDILKITAEPACAASLAALVGPLKDRAKGRHVGIIACGSNIGMARYGSLLAQT
ncbi:threonine ammonia-lyase [Sulfitobacter guttiformis]|uniref:Threonine dehydratase n=1 Tax=Sulfitobacter guttiformis TaxID=74349 RepID=A0A420DTB8_9RHOB|nr:pyridoxal-phosphate dependent enzyme [Sulfitobacter guttiformis]KIN71102.1 Phenylserine dehydratase [Sulfitobacter guttiformis KCTC 32187]RKE97584.1 threonine dehydratase [Sulfitobacter guttiformis]